MIRIEIVIVLSIFASVGASESPPAEDRKAVIDTSNAPAAPPESAEARIALRQHREITKLNRFIFEGNVLKGIGDLVDHWIVMFCPGWHEKCQGLLPSFELLGVQWENKLNKDVMSSSVRFAKVDCATDKALCVSLDIEDYPTVVHYRNNERVNSWQSGAPGLVRFVKQELEGPKRRPRPQAAKTKTLATCSADGDTSKDAAPQGAGATSVWRSLSMVIALLAATSSAVVFATKHLRSRQGRSIPGSKHDPSSGKQPTKVGLPQEWGSERRSIVL